MSCIFFKYLSPDFDSTKASTKTLLHVNSMAGPLAAISQSVRVLPPSAIWRESLARTTYSKCQRSVDRQQSAIQTFQDRRFGRVVEAGLNKEFVPSALARKTGGGGDCCPRTPDVCMISYVLTSPWGLNPGLFVGWVVEMN